MVVIYSVLHKAMAGVSRHVLLAFMSLFFAFVAYSSSAHAQSAPACFCQDNSCSTADCQAAVDFIDRAHEEIRDNTKSEFDDDLDAFEDWMIDVFVGEEIVPAMASMAMQMGAVAMQYTQIVGSFLDAQTQMETQRLFRKLTFEAHKDYRLSEDFCWFGTNARSLAATENKANYNSLALSQIAMNRQLGNHGVSGSVKAANDYEGRWRIFVTTYCDPRDNNWVSSGTGLELACDHDGPGGSSDTGAEAPKRINRDIDYTMLIDHPRTLDIDFTDNDIDSPNPLLSAPLLEPGDEVDVMELSKNLYGSKVPSRQLSRAMLGSRDGAQKLYLSLRSVVAKRSVAMSSFNAIVSMKASGTAMENILLPQQTQRFMAAVMKEILPPESVALGFNIFDLIGYNPSYYSQLEILAKRIYQSPNFYSNLYDTPANVSRKKVAMRAIDLMVDRAIYESQLRREMNISVLLSSELRAAYRLANKNLTSGEAN